MPTESKLNPPTDSLSPRLCNMTFEKIIKDVKPVKQGQKPPEQRAYSKPLK